MRILLALAFIITFSASAYAEGNTITVINEDGTKTSISIDAPPVEADPTPPVKPGKMPESKPEAKPAPQKQAVKKETPAKQTAVKKEAAKKSAAPKKKKAVSAKKQTTQKKQAASAKPVPAPTQAPSRPATAQRLGPNMTSDDAIRIAVDSAPPARSVHASPVNYKGLHAYEVVFTTENGNRFIYVDRETGRVVQ